MVSLEEMRKQYDIAGLDRNDLCESPTEMFRNWFEKIQEFDTLEPNAMTLATSSPSGKPTSRVVLLKEYDEKGFIFYTNYESTKGKRWVIYADEIDASKIPVEWHSWIHFTPNKVEKIHDFKKYDWQKPHKPNLTGTEEAYYPNKNKDAIEKKYKSWKN